MRTGTHTVPTILRLILLVVAACPLLGQKPIADLTLHVTDDFGGPVRKLQIEVKTFASWTPGRDFGVDNFDTQILTTDDRGICRLTMPSVRGELKFEVKEGQGVYGRRWEYRFSQRSGEHWLPQDSMIAVVVKPIVKPIAMVVLQTGSDGRLTMPLPANVESADFDFFKGDWVTPNGNGEVGDVRVTIRQIVPMKDRLRPFDTRLELEFLGANNGIAPASPVEPGYSQLPLPRYAPENGYNRTFQAREFRDATGPISRDPPLDEGRQSGYFFRIRTRINGEGNAIGSYYGKIVGPIIFGGSSNNTLAISLLYFLGSVEGDRNMENDRTMNLFPKRDGAGRPLK